MSHPNENGEKTTISAQLVELASERYRFGQTPAGEPYAVPHDPPYAALPLRSLRSQLAALYHDQTGKVPSASALGDALAVAEGRALGESPEIAHLRIGRHENGIVLDLGNKTGKAIIVSPSGWANVKRSPVLFRRTILTSPLPVPTQDGHLEQLRDLLNVTAEDWPLVPAWLVATLLCPTTPVPALFLTGEQGTGKSTCARTLAQLIDPSPAPLRTVPKDLDQWAVGASGSRLVAIDNISYVPGWLSDAWCRAVTGDGTIRRALYSNNDLTILAFQRALIVTAIDAGALRGDLASRIVAVELERLDERRLDDDLTRQFTALHPQLLGAVLSLAADVLRILPTIQMTQLQRMADWTRILAATDQILGTNGLARYESLAGRLAGDLIEENPVATAIRQLAHTLGHWTGTARDLLDQISPDEPPKHWPANPRALSAALKRHAPALRSAGIALDFQRGMTQRLISISTQSGHPEKDHTSINTKPQMTHSAHHQGEQRFDLDIHDDEQGDLWVIFNDTHDGTPLVNDGTQ